MWEHLGLATGGVAVLVLARWLWRAGAIASYVQVAALVVAVFGVAALAGVLEVNVDVLARGISAAYESVRALNRF